MGFAIDELEHLPGGSMAEITMVKQMKKQIICFDDETKLENGIIMDRSGPRSNTYHNSFLNCAHSWITCGSCHTTGGLAITMGGELISPLIIYDSNAK